jgi:Listeria/Bacterioides repeat
MKTKAQNKKYVFLSMIVCIMLILQGWICGSSVYAQSTSTAANAGREFYITYLRNSGRITTLQMKVVVHKACYITAKYNNQPSAYWNNWNNTLVQPGIYTDGVTYDDVVNTSTQKTNKSITLTSTEDVNVYAINYYNASTDGTCILPTPTWGTEYRLATGVPYSDGSLYSVVAKENNTVVTLHNNSTVTLNTGEVYHYFHTLTDITGMKVSATKPVALYSGAGASYGPSQSPLYCGSYLLGSSSGDHIYEQLWSIDKWGKDFFAWPILTPNGFGKWGGMLALIANEDVTTITISGDINGGTPIDYVLNAGEKQYVCHLMTGLTRIVSDKSIMVFIVLPDATVTSIPATDQRIEHATVAPFILSGATNINAHGIDLLVPAAYWDQTVIKENGVVVSNSTYTVNTSTHYPDWYNIRKNLPNINVTIDITCPGGFLAYVSGSGSAETYAFMAGAGAYDLQNYFTIKEQATTIDTYYGNTNSITHTFESTDQIVVKRTIESPFSSVSWLINGTPYSITENTNSSNTLSFPASAFSQGENHLSMSVRYSGTTADSVYTGSVWLLSIEEYFVCRGDTAIITASLDSEGSIINPLYKWYDAFSGGTLLSTNQVFKTSKALIADTVFYVSVEGDNFCAGGRLAVFVKVEDCATLVPDTVTVIQNGQVLIDVKANDSIPNCPSVIPTPTTPLHGTAVTVGDKILYKPNTDYFGPDTLEYSVICSGTIYTTKIYITVFKAPTMIKEAILLPGNTVLNGSYPNPVSILFRDTINYSITAANTGLPGGETLIITDTVPPYLSFVTGSDNPSASTTTTTTFPAQTVLKWTFPSVPLNNTRIASFKATPQSGSVASQPLFINKAFVTIVRTPGDSTIVPTNGTFHQGGGISITIFSAGYGGSIYNAEEQALDYMTTPRSGVIVVPNDGYRFTGWSHDDYVSLRGTTVKGNRGIMHYDTLTIYGNVELTANFEIEKYPVRYRLNGGRNSNVNPSVYSIESGVIALQAPEKDGDMFIGWTGSNGDEPQLNVVIQSGSTGELLYYANFLESGRENDTIEETVEDDFWAYGNELYVRTSKPGSVVRIFSVEGVLLHIQTIVTAGETKIRLTTGLYAVTLNNGIGRIVRIE